MSTKVILRADVRSVGKRGDICEVKDGFARNYLYPKGLAIAASDGAVAQAAAMRRAREQALEHEAELAAAQAQLPPLQRARSLQESALAVLLGLGTWQIERLIWKEGLIAERHAAVTAPPGWFVPC